MNAARSNALRNGIWPGRGIISGGFWRIKTTTRRKTGGIAERTGSACRGGGSGCPPKLSPEERKKERRDIVDRNEVERFFSREKRTCGAVLFVSKLEETTLSSIALSVLVANLFGIPFGPFYIIFLREDQNIGKKHHILRLFNNDDSFS